MALQLLEFRFPPMKVETTKDSATGKRYFKNVSSKVANVVTKTSNNITNKYELDTISLVSGRLLLQAPNDIYLVAKNTDSNNKSLWLCFKIVESYGGLDAFNSQATMLTIDIDAAIKSAPSNTIQINTATNVVILDSVVMVDKLPLLSKYHNIIPVSLSGLRPTTIDSVKQVKTTASCKPASDNAMPEKQKLVTHTIMILITFLVTVGVFVFKSSNTNQLTNPFNNQININNLITKAIFVLWFLLVAIVAPMAANIRNKEMAQTAVVVKYLVLNFGIVVTVLNWSTIKEYWNRKENLITTLINIAKQSSLSNWSVVAYVATGVSIMALTGVLFLQ